MHGTSALIDAPQKQRDRLAFIEMQAWFCGEVSRQDIVDRFGVQTAAATRDLALYRRLAPNNLSIHGSRKIYQPTEQFTPLFEFNPQRVTTWLTYGFGDEEPIVWDTGIPCTVTEQLAQPKLHHLAAVCRAIKQQQAILIEYEGLNGSSTREIAPFALHSNTHRWYARAFDRKTNEFRDFVISRITSAKPSGAIKANERAHEDDHWNRKIELELVPHPDLTNTRSVLLDYDFDNAGIKKVKVRAAVAGYALRQWGVDCSEDHSRKPNEHQLWLNNRQALYGVPNLILAPGYEDKTE